MVDNFSKRIKSNSNMFCSGPTRCGGTGEKPSITNIGY